MSFRLTMFDILLNHVYSANHSLSKYARRGRGVEQKHKPCVQEEMGVDTSEYVRTKSFLACIL